MTNLNVMDNKEEENHVYMDVKTNKEDIITKKKKTYNRDGKGDDLSLNPIVDIAKLFGTPSLLSNLLVYIFL